MMTVAQLIAILQTKKQDALVFGWDNHKLDYFPLDFIETGSWLDENDQDHPTVYIHLDDSDEG